MVCKTTLAITFLLGKIPLSRRSDLTRLEDIARRAGVSTMTVSRALRGVEGVSSAKRAEIEEIAKALKYLPNLPAKAMAEANSGLVGISFPTLFNEVFADMLQGMRSVFERQSIATIVSTSDYSTTQELDWAERLVAWRPAGMVLTGSHHADELIGLLSGTGIPVVEIWDWRPDPIDMCVGLDHQDIGLTLGRKLKAAGYRAPGFVGCPEGLDPRAEARLRGLMQAFDQEIPAGRSASRNAFQLGYDGCAELLSSSPDIDLIFGLNDHVAYGAWMHLQSQGMDVPAQIGLVGFNDLGLLNVLPVKLTTMRTPREQIGVLAAKAIVARCAGVTSPVRLKLEAEFVQGSTTR